MKDAIGLLFILPSWYFGSLFAITSVDAWILGIVPWVGVFGLAFGIVWGIKSRQGKVLWILVSLLLSQAFVGFAGLYRGQVETDLATWIIWIFLAAQLAFASFLTFRFNGMRIAASGLSVFALSYAFFAAFVAGMALTDTWL